MDGANIPLPPGDDEFGDAQQQEGPRNQQQQPYWNPYMFQAPWQPPFMQPPFMQPPFMQPTVMQPQNRDREFKIAAFWKGDPVAWFKAVELQFRRLGVEDSHHRFELVLPNLQEELVEQLRAILRSANTMADPYGALKAELLQQFRPNVQEQLNGILYGPELGGRPPTMLMRHMLNLLPEGEQAGLLFKHIFLQRLPADIRDLTAAKLSVMDARELAEFADTLWHVRNARKTSGKPVMAVDAEKKLDDDVEELTSSIAAIGVDKKKKTHLKKGRATKGGQTAGKNNNKKYLCWKHCKFGDQAWSCEDEQKCTWAEN